MCSRKVIVASYVSVSNQSLFSIHNVAKLTFLYVQALAVVFEDNEIRILSKTYSLMSEIEFHHISMKAACLSVVYF